MISEDKSGHFPDLATPSGHLQDGIKVHVFSYAISRTATIGMFELVFM